MHRLASFISSLILSPVYWILILVTASFLFRNKRIKKASRIAALCIFLIFSNPVILSWFAKKWQGPRGIINPAKVYSCGIVLGGFASMDAEEFAYFNGSADRFIQVLKLYKVGEIQHILISGGNGNQEKKGFQEAAWVKNELTVMGVPDSVIFIEDKSTNTADNAINSKKILDSIHLKPPYLLVTSAYHIPRATLLFNKAGVATEPFACNYSAGNGAVNFSSFLPRLWVLGTWETYLKEAAGYWWYK